MSEFAEAGLPSKDILVDSGWILKGRGLAEDRDLVVSMYLETSSVEECMVWKDIA